jgi:hypothetical protein
MLSCDDGDLNIETLDFDSVTLQTCEAVSITQTNILFKLSNNEALIMILGANVLKKEVGVVDLEITAATSTKIIYRIFSAAATKNYFCDVVPLVLPVVIEEIIASQATIRITTIEAGTVAKPTFEHKIAITKITLETAQGQRITDLSVSNFGTVTTN